MIFARVALPFIAGYFVAYHYRIMNAVLGPTLAAEFDLSAGGLGLMSSMYFLAFGAFQIPLGLLLDRFGPRRVNAALFLVAAAGGAWFALAESAASAIAARALIGIGVSCALMGSFTAFVLWYPPERISTMNSVAFASGALGGITATVPLEMLLRVWPWREAMLLLVAATVAVSIVLWLVVPERTAREAGREKEQASLGAQLAMLASLLRDGAFLRLAVCLGGCQFAAVSLQSLWIGPWLRDISGYSPAEVARGLLAVNVAMIAGYLGIGRLAERRSKRGASLLPLLMGGVASSALALGAIILLDGAMAVPLWCVFIAASTSVVLGYSIVSRRYPPAMAGRVNTAINTFAFVGMFSGQWAIGIVLDFWPSAPEGYAREAYPWALGLAWAVQLAGLAWLWAGHKRLWPREFKPFP